MKSAEMSSGEEDAARLNGGCFCRTLDRGALAAALDQEVGAAGFAQALGETHPSLFSDTPVFVPDAALARLRRAVEAVEAAARLPGYRDAALAWAEPLARRDFGPAGALMGYDFHLADSGPKLIEINTNAGGFFLNAPLGRAQRACCAGTAVTPLVADPRAFTAGVADMFRREWRRQRGEASLRTLAIVDDAPEAQFLYPEFRLARRALEAEELEVAITDPAELSFDGEALSLRGEPVDLVYNRLVDFALQDPMHVELRRAYEAGAVVLTPNPHVYALYADKRNLTLLSDTRRLRAWGLADAHASVLHDVVPYTVTVAAENADVLWAERRRWFFKPARGHASKAAYRGEKLTSRVWEEIRQGSYVAQAYAPPGVRRTSREGEAADLRVDLRLYTYAGEVLLVAARLYRGQTTNMRTPGGGFSPVLVVGKPTA